MAREVALGDAGSQRNQPYGGRRCRSAVEMGLAWDVETCRGRRRRRWRTRCSASRPSWPSSSMVFSSSTPDASRSL